MQNSQSNTLIDVFSALLKGFRSDRFNTSKSFTTYTHFRIARAWALRQNVSIDLNQPA
jgi:hypothetical protein